MWSPTDCKGYLIPAQRGRDAQNNTSNFSLCCFGQEKPMPSAMLAAFCFCFELLTSKSYQWSLERLLFCKFNDLRIWNVLEEATLNFHLLLWAHHIIQWPFPAATEQHWDPTALAPPSTETPQRWHPTAQLAATVQPKKHQDVEERTWKA